MVSVLNYFWFAEQSVGLLCEEITEDQAKNFSQFIQIMNSQRWIRLADVSDKIWTDCGRRLNP